MSAKKFVYKGNKSVYNTTSILQVGDYAAIEGQVIPIKESDYNFLIPHFVLEPSEGDITATKIKDPEDLTELVQTTKEIVDPEAKTLIVADPEGSATSSSEGTLKSGNGSGGGK